MRPDIGLGEYRAAGRGAWFALEAVNRRWRGGVAISPVGQDESKVSPAAVIRSAAA